MKTYKCEYFEYIDGKDIKARIEADSYQEAYEKFLKKEGIHDCPVVVKAGLLGSGKFFKDHCKTDIDKNAQRDEARKKKREDVAQKALTALEAAKPFSYLQLSPENREGLSGYFASLVSDFEDRGLEPIEIKFVHGWLNFKDRGLGESLIAKRIASLPAAERSSSRFGNMMLLGMMANTTRLENALDDVQGEIASIGDEVGEIQEDVGDMHEGFGFEE